VLHGACVNGDAPTDLLGRVAMGQMHLDANAAAAKLRLNFVQNALNLVAFERRRA
jgi:hypothetical protein